MQRMHFIADTLLVVADDPATRALARTALSDYASNLLECTPDDFAAFVQAVRFDLVVMIGTSARRAREAVRRRLDQDARDEVTPQLVVATTLAEALRLVRQRQSLSRAGRRRE